MKIVPFNILHFPWDFSLVFLFFLSTLPLPAICHVTRKHLCLGEHKMVSFLFVVLFYFDFLSISSDTRRKLQYNSQQWKQHRINWLLNIELEWQNGKSVFRFHSIGNFHWIIGDTWKSLWSISTFYWLDYQFEIGKLSIMNLSNKILYI